MGWDCFGLELLYCTYIPAALLAEAHLAAGDDDDGRLGVRLADLVAAVVVAALAEVGLAAIHRARRALRPGGATGTRARALHRARGRRGWRSRCSCSRRRLLRPVGHRPELAEPAELEVDGALRPARRPARGRRVGRRGSCCGGNARRRRGGSRGCCGGDGRRLWHGGVVLQVGQVPGHRHLEIPIHEWNAARAQALLHHRSPSASAVPRARAGGGGGGVGVRVFHGQDSSVAASLLGSPVPLIL